MPTGAEHWPRLLRSGLQAAEGAMTRHDVVLLARSLCRFRHFDLSAVPLKDRRAVLRNLLLAWAPFDTNAFALVLGQDEAQAWAWNADAVTERISQAGLAECQVLPEALFQSTLSDGPRLLAGLDGIELQQWTSGRLKVSRWWAEMPSAAEQQAMAAAMSLPVHEPFTVAAPPTWLRKAWAESQSLESLTGQWSRMEQWVLGVGLVSLVGFGAAQAHDSYMAYQQREQLALALKQAQDAAAPVLKARSQALAQSDELGRLAAQLSSPQSMEVILYLSRHLPAQGVTLKELELNGSKLRLGIEVAPSLQRSAIIKQLQAGGWMINVNEQREAVGRPWAVFEMSLKSTQMPVLEPLSVAGGKP